MEKNNHRFYYALGALSLFALALFQGAQFFTSQYESQVLGWSSTNLQNFKMPNFSGMTLPNGQKLNVPSIPPMPSMPALPTGFDMSQWQSFMGSENGNTMGAPANRSSIRSKLGLGKGISCTTAMELFDTLCADGNVTASEAISAGQNYVQGLRDQAAAQDPRGAQGDQFLDQYLPEGMPSRPSVSPGAGSSSIGAQRNGPIANGLSCDTIQKLLDTQSVCADGTISREEIRSISSSLKATLMPSGRPSKVMPSGTAQFKQCTFCGSGCAFITPDMACPQVMPEPGAKCVVQNGACVKVAGGI